MPSPFPGMDPYIEGVDWPSFHIQLSVEIARYLGPRLRPKYFVRAEKAYILTTPEQVAEATGLRLPDVSVTARPPTEASSKGGAVTLEAPLHLDVVMPEELPQVTIEVYDAAERSLVTAIEMLSPWNKRGEGRQEYLVKRRRMLRSKTHLMEIDLLRKGRRVPMASPLPSTPYVIVLSREDRRPRADVWPIGLREPLPEIPVPLLPGDNDVAVDLQDVFTTMYNTFSYDLDVDYTRTPAVPLSPEDAKWAESLLATWTPR